MGKNAAVLFAMLLAVACIGHGPTESADHSGCGFGTVLTVSPGANPTFSWAPTCLAYELRVTRTPRPADTSHFGSWMVFSLASNKVPSGVTYPASPTQEVFAVYETIQHQNATPPPVLPPGLYTATLAIYAGFKGNLCTGTILTDTVAAQAFEITAISARVVEPPLPQRSPPRPQFVCYAAPP